MSAATATAPTERLSALEVYRDDGPLALAIGRVAGRAGGLRPLALVAVGMLPAIVAVVAGGDDVSRPVAGAVLAWLVVLAGASSARPEPGPLRWLIPSAMRLIEYGGLLWIAALAGPSSLPAAFALLAAVAFRHYDLVYRLRHRGVIPPAWLNAGALGWDGRLIGGYVLLVAGALPAGLFIAAALLAVVAVGESVIGWARYGRTQRIVGYEDEEDEGQ